LIIGNRIANSVNGEIAEVGECLTRVQEMAGISLQKHVKSFCMQGVFFPRNSMSIHDESYFGSKIMSIVSLQ
jgi:hypothetical protein